MESFDCTTSHRATDIVQAALVCIRLQSHPALEKPQLRSLYYLDLTVQKPHCPNPRPILDFGVARDGRRPTRIVRSRRASSPACVTHGWRGQLACRPRAAYWSSCVSLLRVFASDASSKRSLTCASPLFTCDITMSASCMTCIG